MKWRDNSLSLARKLNYDPNILNKTKVKTLWDTINPDNLPSTLSGNPILFGFCRYGPTHCLVEVPEINISTYSREERTRVLGPMLKAIGVKETDIEKIRRTLEEVSNSQFYEIFNQSGVDHELMGHAYHFFADHPYGETAAVETQIRFAEERAKNDPSWKTILGVMPKVLGHLKGIEKLK